MNIKPHRSTEDFCSSGFKQPLAENPLCNSGAATILARDKGQPVVTGVRAAEGDAPDIQRLNVTIAAAQVVEGQVAVAL